MIPVYEIDKSEAKQRRCYCEATYDSSGRLIELTKYSSLFPTTCEPMYNDEGRIIAYGMRSLAKLTDWKPTLRTKYFYDQKDNLIRTMTARFVGGRISKVSERIYSTGGKLIEKVHRTHEDWAERFEPKDEKKQ